MVDNETIRLHDAMEHLEQKLGRKVKRVELGARLWPNDPYDTFKVKTHMLFKGRKLIDAHTVRVICEFTGVDANFLFKVDP